MNKSSFRRIFGLILGATLMTGIADAATFPTIYVFGDSLSDAGNDWNATDRLLPISPPYSFGRFSNGAVWVQELGTGIGAGAIRASLTGGTDFAFGGAESGKTMVHSLQVYDLPGQLFRMRSTPCGSARTTCWISWPSPSSRRPRPPRRSAKSSRTRRISSMESPCWARSGCSS